MALDLKSVRKAPLAQGWVEDVSAKGHVRYTPPDRTKKTGRPRSIRSFLADMKRSGLVWPPPGKGR